MVFLEFQSKFTKFRGNSWNSSQSHPAFITGFPMSSMEGGGGGVDIFWNNPIHNIWSPFVACCSFVEWSNPLNILPNFADARTQQSLKSGQTRRTTHNIAENKGNVLLYNISCQNNFLARKLHTTRDNNTQHV